MKTDEIEIVVELRKTFVFVVMMIALLIGMLFVVSCANFHAQDCADLMYKFAPQYIFDNDELNEKEKEASFIGAALGQSIDSLEGDDIAEIWKVYEKMKEKEIIGNPVEYWKLLVEKKEIEQFLFEPQTKEK